MMKAMYGVSLGVFSFLVGFLFSTHAVGLSEPEIKSAKTIGASRYKAWKAETAKLRTREGSQKETNPNQGASGERGKSTNLALKK